MNNNIFSRAVPYFSDVSGETERFGIKFTVVLYIFIFWSLLQLIFPAQFLTFALVESTNYLKVVLPAVGSLLAGALYFNNLRFDYISMPFILFCLYVFCNSSFHIIVGDAADLQSLSPSVMLIVWAFYLFVVVPSVFNSINKITLLLRATTYLTFITILFLSIWSFSQGYPIGAIFGGSRMGGIRYSFPYLNPSYLGGICYSVICGAMMLFELSKKKMEIRLMVIIVMLSLGVMSFAGSRAYTLASGTLFYFYFWRGHILHKIILQVMAGCFAALSYIIILQLTLDVGFYEKLNYISSNRFDTWVDNWKILMSNGIEWKIFLGNGLVDPQWSQGIVLAEGRVEKTFQRFAIDNVYLEMIIMHGLIGLGLLLHGFIRLFKVGYSLGGLEKRVKSKKLSRLLSIAYGSILGALVSAVFSSHFPSLGNTINSIVFPAALAIIYIVKAHTR